MGDWEKSLISYQQLKNSMLSTLFSYQMQNAAATEKKINSVPAKTKTVSKVISVSSPNLFSKPALIQESLYSVFQTIPAHCNLFHLSRPTAQFQFIKTQVQCIAQLCCIHSPFENLNNSSPRLSEELFNKHILSLNCMLSVLHTLA